MIKLLLVEDDPNLRYVVQCGLEDIIGGYDVQTAVNGEEGLKTWASFKPDIIISDIDMTMLVCAAERMLGAVRRKNGMGSTGGVFCLLAFGGSFLAYRLPIWSWAVGAAIFWGVVPILTQVIVNIKKSEK